MKKYLSLPIFIWLLSFNFAGAQTYSLQQLKDSAMHNNIAIRNSRHNIEYAAEQSREAFTKYFPSVSVAGAWFNTNKSLINIDLSPLGMPTTVGFVNDGTLASITALQPVFAGGKIVNGNRLAKVGEDVAKIQSQLSENEVEKQTEQYFWQLVVLQEKLRTINVVDSLLLRLAKDVSVAIDAGVALRNDLLQVELRQNDIAGQRLKVENGIQTVRLLLAQYCGLRDPAFVIDANIDMPVDTQCSMFSVQNTPEYQLLQKQVEAATLQKKIAVGQNLPTIAVGAGYSYNNLMDKSQNRAMIFATVSVPISDWWGGTHAVRRKKIVQHQAEEQLANNAELLQIRMFNAWNNVVEAQQQLALARQSIEQSKENFRLHRNYYRAGTATMSDLLEAQLLYQQTLDKRVEAYTDLQNKLLEYRQSIGGQGY